MIIGTQQALFNVSFPQQKKRLAEAAECIGTLGPNKRGRMLARYLQNPSSALKERGLGAQERRRAAQLQLGSFQAGQLPNSARQSIRAARSILRRVFVKNKTEIRKLVKCCRMGFHGNPKEIRTEAFNRVFDCYKDPKCDLLDLSGLGIKRLPPRFPGCGHVTEVDLTDNRFTAVPRFLGMPGLKLLRLDGNRLSRSPSPAEVSGIEVSFLDNKGTARDLRVLATLCNIEDESIPIGLYSSFVVPYVQGFLADNPKLPLSTELKTALGSLTPIVDVDEDQAIGRLRQGKNVLILAGWQAHRIVFDIRKVLDGPMVNIRVFNAGEGAKRYSEFQGKVSYVQWSNIPLDRLKERGFFQILADCDEMAGPKAIKIVYKELPGILGVAPARELTGDQQYSAVPLQKSGNCALYSLYAACYQIDRDSTETLWHMMRCKEVALIIDDPGIPKKDPTSSATYEKICQFMKEEKARIPKDHLQKLSRCMLHLSGPTS
ncbi:MAG: leucine-rich repeat domain-containing protein [Chlamydiia bacterium]